MSCHYTNSGSSAKNFLRVFNKRKKPDLDCQCSENHRNTLLYRLDKLSELLNINLREADQSTLFYLLISCVLVEYF
ncbi:MAG: helix-turn-helix domain-containing protein [Eubacteriaceae bacterium]